MPQRQHSFTSTTHSSVFEWHTEHGISPQSPHTDPASAPHVQTKAPSGTTPVDDTITFDKGCARGWVEGWWDCSDAF